MNFAQGRTTAGKTAKVSALATTSTLIIAAFLASSARAQDVETVVVSASRITANGFSAPTPTTVIGAADIETSARPNVFDTITELPSLQGSTGTQSGNGGTSSANNGLSSFNERGLGTIRTLTLLDSQRYVPAYVTGATDVSLFPQLLISRVDVVTGGASASWGSDAVGGVVNFVTNKKFTGIKGNVQAGMSTYGDDTQALFQLAGGTGFSGGKGHIEASAEFYRNDGVPAPNIVGGAMANGRCCNVSPGYLSYTLTTTPAGLPMNTYQTGVQSISSADYTLITSVPASGGAAAAALKGIVFDANGDPEPFRYGSNCVGTNCVGGDLTSTTLRVTVDAPITRSVFYTRASYDVAPGWEVYGTYTMGDTYAFNQPSGGAKTNVAIACGNAPNGGGNFYLPAAINAACVTAKITTFSVGITADKLPTLRIKSKRQIRRYVAGTDGKFSMFGSDWNLDAYYQHGESDNSTRITNAFLNARYFAAIDAIAGPNGTVTCRLSAAAAPGCVPLNVFNATPPSAQAWSYVSNNPAGPVSITSYRQEAAGFAVNGAPFKDWTGDVSMAYGAEYREEAYETTADPYGNGITADTPATAAYPVDAVLAASDNWFAGNFHIGHGNYHVAEAFVDVGLPLFNGPQWGKLDAEIAGREAHYSTAGWASTWKVGVTWDTPLDGLRLRALQSRDLRAPNLSELFKAPIVQNQGVRDNTLPLGSPNITVLNENIGNVNLKPETAQTTEIGAVYQPDYLPGFSVSLDYYRVGIKKGVGSLTNQQEIDLCQLQGNQAYCGLFFLKGLTGSATPNYVIIQPFNLAAQVMDGFDIEASYQFDLEAMGVPGNFVLRALATHTSKSILDSGVLGQPVAELAGALTAPNGGTGIGGGNPLWKGLFTQSWNADPISLNFTERLYSDGVLNPYAIVCQNGSCPQPTALHPTYNYQHVPGYFYLDIGGSYKISEGMQAFFRVTNVTDLLPSPEALAVGGGQVLGGDPVGRVYRVGFRFNS
jgi:outer membrane receptor protein involved in Fe transport